MQTGGLFKIDGKTFAEAYNDLVSSSRAVMGDARALAYWCDESGGGRFTPLAANALKAFMQATIDGHHPEVTAGFQNEVSSRYSKWKGSHGFAGSPWKRTGAVRNSFIVTNQKVGKKSMAMVTIDPAAVSERITYSGEVRGTVSADKLVGYLEFGTKNMQARPLMSTCTRIFVGQTFPRMAKAIGRSVQSWVKNGHSNQASPRDTMGNAANVMGQASRISTVEQLACARVDTDISMNQASELFSSEGRNSGFGISSGTDTVDSQIGKDDAMYAKMARESGMSEEDIKIMLDGLKGS